MGRFGLAAALIGVVAGLAVTPAAAAQTSAPAKFCKAYLVVDSAENPSPKQVKKFQTTAPAEIADTVDAVVKAFQEQGDDAFIDPTFVQQLADVDQFVVDGCGYDQQFDVSMQDFSFTGIPAELSTGKVAFTITNDGQELHEMSIYKLKAGKTLDDVLAAHSEKEALKVMTPVPGGGFAFPGTGDTALFEIKKAGDYVALCSIPVGSTPDAGDEGGSGPPHLAEGMAVQFTVA